MRVTHWLASSFTAFVRFAVLASLFLGLAACDEEEWTETPEGFVEQTVQPFTYKALAPDGSVIGVRHRDNDEEGSLAFWGEVFENEMVKAKGYKLIDKEEVTSADGADGVLMQFEYAQGNTPFHYSLALFVTEKSIVTMETGAELASLERHEGAFAAARKTLRVKLRD